MKKLIVSAVLATVALAATPLLAHQGERAAGCTEGAARTQQGPGAGQGMGGMHRMGGMQAMGGKQGMGERMSGNHERMAARMQGMQDCPQAKQPAAQEEHKH